MGNNYLIITHTGDSFYTRYMDVKNVNWDAVYMIVWPAKHYYMNSDEIWKVINEDHL